MITRMQEALADVADELAHAERLVEAQAHRIEVLEAEVRHVIRRVTRATPHGPPPVLTAHRDGSKLGVVDCPSCGRPNREDARFCDACGQLLTSARSRPDPAALTPVHLADRIRRERPAEGERRTVTVLFVDAVGSTPLAEKLGEEEMYSLMR